MERKFLDFKFETKDDDAEEGVVVGYGAVFNNVDHGGDIILPGAFLENLTEGKTVPILWQHDPSNPIGVWTDIEEDANGLRMKGRILPSVQKGAEALALLRAKAIHGLSIGYNTDLSSYNDAGNRLLHKLSLWECSVCTFAMNPKARVDSVKSLKINDVETLLRDAAGFSRNEAKALLSGGFKALSDLRDAETKGSKDVADAELKQELVALLKQRFASQ